MRLVRERGAGQPGVSLRCVFCGLAAAAIALCPTAPARAQAFLEPDARLFTLLWPDSGLGRELSSLAGMAALPDGSIVIATSEPTKPNVHRLGIDGAVTRLLGAGNADALAVDAGGALIVATSSGAIQRVAFDGSARQPIADLGRPVRHLAALDNGELVAATGSVLWSIQPSGVVNRLAAPGTGSINSVTPLGGARILVVRGSGPSSIVATDGFTRQLPPLGECCANTSALRDGRVLVKTWKWDTEDGVPRVAFTTSLLDREGAALPLTPLVEPALGNGDGTATAGGSWPGFRTTHAADGALIYTEGTSYAVTALRAAVPAASPRARIAFAQSAYQTFAQGRVAYVAPVGGPLELEIRQGKRIVERVTGFAAAPGGELAFPPPARGAYDLRLRLGAGAEARTRVDTRTILPIADARAALSARFDYSDGDEGGREGYRVDHCSRRDARTFDCLLLRYSTGNNLDDTDDYFISEWPDERVSATLRADGIFTAREGLAQPSAVPRLSLAVKRRQVLPGFRAIARITGRDGRADAVLSIRLPGRKRPVIVRAARRVDGKVAWRPRLRVGRSVLRAAARRPVRATLTVTVTSPGLARTEQTVGPLRLRARG